MEHHQPSDFFIPGFELMPLTGDYDEGDDDVDSSSNNADEPMVDWLDDCQVQENLFQIIPLTPEETRCDKNNHIIKSDVKVFFEELGYICDEPEPIDPGRNYEAEYEQQQQQQRYHGSKNARRHRQRRQCHVDLETMPTPSPAAHRHGTLDTVSSPGLSSASSSFYHTDDDEDNIKSSMPHTNRLSYLNHHHAFLYHHQLHHHHHHHHSHHPHHHQSPSTLSKPTVTPSHFSFTSIRS